MKPSSMKPSSMTPRFDRAALIVGAYLLWAVVLATVLAVVLETALPVFTLICEGS